MTMMGRLDRANEAGAALLLALIAMALLSGLGMGLVMMSASETKIADSYRAGAETLYAADAAIERAVMDLGGISQWNSVLTGAVHSPLADSTRRPTLPSQDVLDLDAVTSQLQSAMSGAALGQNTPVWKLFAWGSLASMTSLATTETAAYVAVWVADDPSETDNNPAANANGILTLHAEAYGVGHAKRVVEATVSRGALERCSHVVVETDPMMSVASTAALLAALISALMAPSHSLGELARREALRRMLTPPATHTLTDANLPPSPARSAVPPVADATSPPVATIEPDDDASAKESSKDTEAAWRDRATKLREAVDRDTLLAAALQSRINALTTDAVNRDDPIQRAALVRERQQTIDELAREQLAVQKDKEKLAELEEEARKKGIPAGWIR